MEKLYVIGHSNPDTDSITSAIVAANLQKKLGNDATAYKLGNINKETAYALKTFEVEEPQTLTSVDENCDVALVDNNEFSQSVSGIEKAHVKMVVDHHKIKLETVEPIYFITEPLGCTCTILYKLYKQNEVDIDSQTAGFMLSAIISDTLLFKSPTCTEEDKEIAEKLSNIAGVDLYKYGTEMLKAGTDISEFTPFQVINIDSKEFNDKNQAHMLMRYIARVSKDPRVTIGDVAYIEKIIAFDLSLGEDTAYYAERIDDK